MEIRTYTARGAAAEPMLTPAEIERHYRDGRRLQAEAIVGGFQRAFRFLSGRTARADATAPGDVAHTMTSSLAAIRSTAELLRDHPNLDVSERKRFLGRLLEEEQRLERLLPKALQSA